MLRHRILYVLLAAVQCACAQSSGGTGSVSGAPYYDLWTKARAHIAKKEFEPAAAILARLAQSNPDDIEVWISLGRSRSELKQYREAAAAFTEAVQRGGIYVGNYSYGIAQMYAQAGDKEKTLEWLEKSLAAPLENRPRAENDPVFAAWRDDPRFRQLAGLAATGDRNRNDRWRADLDYLAAEMRRMHYSLRNAPLPANLTKAFASLRDRVLAIPDAAMEPEIQRLVAMLGDGHSSVRPASSVMLPFWFYWFSDGLFVIDAPEDCKCVGERVAAIGDTPTDAALKKLEPFLSVDNAMGVKWQAPIYARRPEYLRAAGVIAQENEVALTLEGAHGKHRVVARPEQMGFRGFKLFPSKASGAPDAPLYLQRVSENYWFQPMSGGDTVYFQFNQVQHKPDEDMGQFARRLERAVEDKRVRNLIIDMRHNTGGNLGLFPPILRVVLGFEASRENAAIYVITGRQTFSAAQVFCNEVDAFTSAIFAGEPTGSRPNFIGESAPTRLPYSGIAMTISTRYHQTEDMDHRMWIAPKIPVALSSADYFANRDPALDAVLAAIKSRP
jgi:tetratricopeptide (TPR) repeat protein